MSADLEGEGPAGGISKVREWSRVAFGFGVWYWGVGVTTTPSVDRVRAVRERLITTGTVVAKSDGRSCQLFPVAIGPEEGRALSGWVRREAARRTLESGLGFAISTLYICEGLLASGTDARHVAADPYQFVTLPTHTTRYGGVGLQVLEEAGVRDLVEFYDQESQMVFPGLLADGRERPRLPGWESLIRGRVS